MDRLSTRVIMPSGQRSTVSGPFIYNDTSNATTYNFNNIPVVDGLLIISIHAGETVAGISSVTVNGSSATVHCSINNPATAAATAGIASYLLTGSTSVANVSVTFSASTERCTIACHILNNSTQYRFLSFDTDEFTSPVSQIANLSSLPPDATIITAVTHTTGNMGISWLGTDSNYYGGIESGSTAIAGGITTNYSGGDIQIIAVYNPQSGKAAMAVAAFI